MPRSIAPKLTHSVKHYSTERLKMNRLHYIDLRPAPLATKASHWIARAIGALALIAASVALLLSYFDVLTKG
jgi:hypothetical protein